MKREEFEPQIISGRSWASSESSESSEVERFIQEQRSSDAKKADATLVPTQFAIPFSFSYDKIPLKLSIFSAAADSLVFPLKSSAA